MENLKLIPFSQVNFDDTFFDSLKNDYEHGFIEWFNRKSLNPEEKAYVLY
ncbi:N-acetyltransferase, partial [Escherichia coli]|nr:N-acetyltransferase [Escherichia coli]